MKTPITLKFIAFLEVRFPRIYLFLKKYGQLLINLDLFFCVAGWTGWHAYNKYISGELNYVEIAFIIQNMILVMVILMRKEHRAVDPGLFNQVIALLAFCSGIALIGQPLTGSPTAQTASMIVTFAANVAGALTLLNLGRSFGILIAVREVKTSWLYSIVRHPMYGTDILLRIGFVLSHCTLYTISIFIFSTACYIYRAILEERFLAEQPEYREYMARVKYRFIPFLF
ncbi:MAG: isoprenylcysteine carboxylmethyltransferase family protein [bacterium]|nr:isoprenylcysteine carboxylmethyltransferase family protein [bacterium]